MTYTLLGESDAVRLNVGLVTGTCFADSGNDVTCIDKDAAKVRTLRRGVMPIYEPGLEVMVKRNRTTMNTLITLSYSDSSRELFPIYGKPQAEAAERSSAGSGLAAQRRSPPPRGTVHC